MDNNQVVELDEELFLSVSREYETVRDSLNGAESFINSAFSCLTGELAGCVSSGSAIAKINKTKEDAFVLAQMIKTAVEMYKSVDEESSLILNTFDDSVDKIFKSSNQEMVEATLEDRMEFLSELLTTYQDTLSELKSEFDKLYGKGIVTDGKDLYSLLDVFTGFDLYEKAGFTHQVGFLGNYKGDGTGNIYLESQNVVEMLKYCNENEVIEKIINYMNGASWEESGLEEFYNDEYFNEDNVIDNLYWCQSAGEVTDSESLREWLKSTNEGWNSAYSDLSEKGNDYSIRSNDIAKLSQAVYELNDIKGLLPYQELLDTVDLSKYKENDWENYKLIDRRNLEYMSLEEAALYDYLYETEGKEGANKYILAMEDTINRREAAGNAIEYLDGLAEKGFDWTDIITSGWDGTEEGVIRFFDGLKNFFAADGKRSVSDYESMYKAQFLLQGSEEYGIDYSEIFTEGEKTFLNMNHQTWSSVGNMLVPSLAGLIPVVGKYASSGLMFMSIAGNSTESALQEGHTGLEARCYGLLTGLSETATERLLGGIPGVSNLGKSFLGNMVSEGLEEFTQEYIDAMVRNVVLKEHNDLASPDLLVQAVESGALGTLTSGILQGGNSVVTTTLNAGVSTVTKGKTNYTDLYNQVESNVAKYSAEKTMTDYLNTNKTDDSSTLGKLKINKALNNISAVELSEVTNSFTEEDINSLKNDASLDVEAKDKLYLAEKVKKVQKSSDLSFLEADIDTLQETVTRDGRTLLEYTVDTKPGLVTEEIVKPIKKVDGKLASKIEERISERNAEVSDGLQKVLSKVEEIALEGENLTTDENTDIASQKFAESLKTALGTVIPKITTSIKNALSLFVPVASVEDGGVTSTSSTTENNTTVSLEEKTAMLTELNDVLINNGSNPDIVQHVIEAFRTTDTLEAFNTLKGLLKIARSGKNTHTPAPFTFYTDDSENSCWFLSENRINIQSVYYDSKEPFFHEISHAILEYSVFEKPVGSRILSNIEEVLRKARVESKNSNLNNTINKQNEECKAIRLRIDSEVTKEYAEKKFENSLISRIFFKNSDNTPSEHKSSAMAEEVNRRWNNYLRDNTETGEFQDITDAIFEGFREDLNGNSLDLWGHGRKYYKNGSYNQLHEIMANWGSAKVLGKTNLFDLVKSTYGTEFYDFIDAIYERMTEYGKVSGSITRTDAEELSVFELVDLLTTYDQIDFDEKVYETLSDDAKKRYDLAFFLKNLEISRSSFDFAEYEKFANMSNEEISLILDQIWDFEKGITIRDYLNKMNKTMLSVLENIHNYSVLSESDLENLSIIELVNKNFVLSSDLSQRLDDNYLLEKKYDKILKIQAVLNGNQHDIYLSSLELSDLLNTKVTEDGLTFESYLRETNPDMLESIKSSITFDINYIKTLSILKLSQEIASLPMTEKEYLRSPNLSPLFRRRFLVAEFLNELNNGKFDNRFSLVNKDDLDFKITEDGITLRQYLQEKYPQVLDSILNKN